MAVTRIGTVGPVIVARCLSCVGVSLAVVLVCGCKSKSIGVVQQSPPAGWADWSTPDRVTTLARACASNSNLTNSVELVGNSIQIHSQTDVATHLGGFLEEPLPFAFNPRGVSGARRVLRVKDGWLVGYNHGEFGGSLWKTDATGKQTSKILNENVVQFAHAFGKAYVFANTVGQGFHGGSIYPISEDGRIGKRIDFTDAPVAFAQDGDSLLLLTFGGVHRVSADLRTDEILSHTELSSFDPNSIAVAPDGSIFVGLKFFVLRLLPEQRGFNEHWLVQTSCKQFHVVPENRECVCDGP